MNKLLLDGYEVTLSVQEGFMYIRLKHDKNCVGYNSCLKEKVLKAELDEKNSSGFAIETLLYSMLQMVETDINPI